MPRFLVRISVELPADWTPEQRAALTAREQERGRALKADGTIQDMWRLPGRIANAGIWRAPSATALHEALLSLPAWPWARIEVEALADHYLTTDPEDAG